MSARGARLMLLVALICAFGPALFGGFVWDDHLLVVNNGLLRDARQLGTLLTTGFWNVTTEGGGDTQYYRPVVTLAFFAQLQLFGLETLGYHVVSLALHAACVLLVFGWLRARLEAEGEQAALAGATCGAALFALHPSRSESVSWISGSTDVWMVLFALCAARLARGPRSVGRDAALALSAALALFSKEGAIVLPAALALEALCSEAAARGAALRAAAVALAGTLGALALRLVWVPLPISHGEQLWFGLPQRVVSSLGHYAEAIAWPLEPTALRGKTWLEPDGSYGVEAASLATGSALLIAGAALLARAVLRARENRRTLFSPYLADAGWLVLPLLPVLNLQPLALHSLVADRLLYWPLTGVCALAARALARAWLRWPAQRRMLVLASSFVLAGYIGVVLQHGQAFASDEALWAYELRRDPEQPHVLEQSRALATNTGQHARALELALAGEQLAARTGRPLLQLQFLLSALGAVSAATADSEQDRLLALRRFYDALAHEGRGALALPPLVIAGQQRLPSLQLDIALSARQRAALPEQVAPFTLARAQLYARTLDPERARSMLQRAAREHPRSLEVALGLVVLEAQLGALSAARRALARAQRAAPGHASVQRAARTLGAVEHVLARAQRDMAAGADPELARTIERAQVELLLGAHASARARLDTALRSKPDAAALIALRVQVDALDQRMDLARARIDAARRDWPRLAPQWDALSRELDAMR